jgi:hypothetical protein
MKKESAMSAGDPVREQVVELVRRATERGFEDAIKDFPMEAINRKAPNVPYTPWALIEHLRVGLWDILEYTKDGRHVSPKWPDEYWPPQDQEVDAATWDKTVASFRADREAFLALLADPATDLLAPVPFTPGHTALREAFLLAGHTTSHLGEFSILREVMQTWPKK